ncbi:Uncharacterized protein FWK35_00029502 [Aphis craccivora]|uniref:Uncharacterized protein n=1 Tax=Aphis craccivora TaxID=307492 RepID=A0A6G0Z3B1_APHCR|nr:Uncharacterized protein FWK35_00029502 [Aphis craccivora]
MLINGENKRKTPGKTRLNMSLNAISATTWLKPFYRGSDSKRSDECIDFTMTITSRNNAPISNIGGGLRCKSEYPWCIIEVKNKHFPTVFEKIGKNKKKKYGKTGIFTHNQFSTKSIFYMVCR